MSKNNLALMLRRQGKWEETERKYGRTLALRELVLSMENSDTLGSAYSLACLLHQRKEVQRCGCVLSSSMRWT